MSYSSLYLAFKTKAKRVQIYPNSWKSCPILWDYLWKNFTEKSKKTWLLLNEYELKELWDTWKNPEVPKCIRAAHLFTFDESIIYVKDKDYIGGLFKEAHKILINVYPERESHWKKIGNDLISLKKIDKRVKGFVFGGTSVSDIWLDRKLKNIHFLDVYANLDLTN